MVRMSLIRWHPVLIMRVIIVGVEDIMMVGVIVLTGEDKEK